jgi:nitrogenase cofactor biosynthesis protein NifB
MPNISVAGIAGPGDALANAEEVFKTFRLIREIDADVLFCISTNGLLLPQYAEELHEAGVTHLTVTVNAVHTATAKRIYRHAEYEGNRFIREEASEILLANQMEGIRLASALGIVCKVNIVLLKGLNDVEIPEIVERVRDAGALFSNIMQLIPVKGTLFETVPLTSREELDAVRKRCENILPQMYHCRQCRADAIGLLEKDESRLFCGAAGSPRDIPLRDAGSGQDESVTGPNRRFAVASKSGVLVDEHFGHAETFSIYEVKAGVPSLLERREVARYCTGHAECRSHEDTLEAIFKTIADCEAVLSLRIGEVPRRALMERGIKAVMTYDYVENAVREAADR